MKENPDKVFQPFHEYSLVNRSVTEFSAFAVRFIMSSTSVLVMLKGGAKPRMSPFGIALAIRFCSRQADETLAPTFPVYLEKIRKIFAADRLLFGFTRQPLELLELHHQIY